jgi:hypothetical protein
MKQKLFSLRRATSLTALLAFIALVFSGVFAYLAPRGPGSSSWGALGLGKHGWFALHTNVGILFLVASVLHTVLNIKPLIAYLKNREGKFRLFTPNFNIALLLTAWVVAGSLLDWPPFSDVANYKESLGNRGHHHQEAVEPEPVTKAYPEKMPFLFSRRSLEGVCEKYNLDQARIIRGLEDNGIVAHGEWSLKRIAEENDTAPSIIFEAIRQLQ